MVETIVNSRPQARVSQLLGNLEGATVFGNGETTVSSIVFDSRRVTPGSIFVALRGGYADGHTFLDEARHAGAVAVLVEPGTPDEAVAGYECVIRAPNTRGALAPLAAAFFREPSRELTVIGITGTDGKTTTCFYLQQMLEDSGIPTGLISTVTVRVPGQPDRSSARQTTPESLDVQRTLREMVDAGAEVAIIETTSHALETHRVDCCEFDIGVVTNITREHLDFHGSVENYRAAKGGLLRRVAQSRRLGKRGAVVLNADDPGCREVVAFAESADRLWYSSSGDPQARVCAHDMVATPDSNTFVLQIDDESTAVRLPLPGSWNVSNALAASSATFALGLDAKTIAKSIERLRAVPGRMEKVDLGQPFTVVVDYAHTAEAIRSVLEEARRITRGRVLVALGSAGERDIEKRAIQGATAAQLADFAIFTSEDPRFEDPNAIIDAIAEGAIQQDAIKGVDFDCIEDRRVAVATLLRRAQPGDVVVLAGKGHERSMIYGSENRPWDEAAVAREALHQLGYRPKTHEGTQV